MAVCPNNTSPRIFADNSSRVCELLCNLSLYYYSDNNTGDCLTVCPGGFFADDFSHACVNRCPGLIESGNQVDTYGFELDHTCKSQCDEGWYAQNTSRLCAKFCPIGEYADTHIRHCVLDCNRLLPEYADNTTNKCVSTCPDLPDMFAENDTFTCVETCPPNYWASNMTRECVQDC